MGRTYRLTGAAVVLALAGCRDGGGGAAADPELAPPDAGASPFLADGPLPGRYMARGRVEGKVPLYGYPKAAEPPRDLAGRRWGEAGAVSVVAYPDEPADYGGCRGFAVRVVNRTDAAVSFTVCDYALYLVREARGADGAWREVESFPETDCGCSYRGVALGPDQYWVFPAREYAGPVRTTTRFRLDIGRKGPTIYSNEFDGLVTPAQLGDRG